MSKTYVAPLRFEVLTPAYDTLVRWSCGEARFRAAMVEALRSHDFGHLIDVGCGTGSLIACLRRAFPRVRITGIDADRAALRIAAAKLAEADLPALLLHGDARRLPLPDGGVGAAASSLFFHHLDGPGKAAVLREVWRCLAPGGVFVVADWDRSGSRLRRLAFNVVRALDGLEVTRLHARGRFADLLSSAGFEVARHSCVPALLGQIGVWTCTKPAGQAGASARRAVSP